MLKFKTYLLFRGSNNKFRNHRVWWLSSFWIGIAGLFDKIWQKRYNILRLESRGIPMSISSFKAGYFFCEVSDWTVTNLELQKILYLSHMVYLGRFNKPLITESFEAWKYGPVLPKLYDRLKRFGAEPIKKYIFDSSFSLKPTEDICKFLEEAWESLGGKPSWELVAMTHRNKGAWEKTYSLENKNALISNDSILSEYKEVVNEK